MEVKVLVFNLMSLALLKADGELFEQRLLRGYYPNYSQTQGYSYSVCSDFNQNCNSWARAGECTNNPAYMKINCKRSCRICVTPCLDYNGNCQYWARTGWCRSNQGYMLINCKKSCGKCPVNGKWTEWSKWKKCSKRCGFGKTIRTRKCTNPAPRNGGKLCTGLSKQKKDCNMKMCPVTGGWSRWSDWSKCSKTCGQGSRTRSRLCNNPKPRFGGRQCAGGKTQFQDCNTQQCLTEAKCGTRKLHKVQSKRVVGGDISGPGEWPWHVGLKRSYDKNIFCGGTLISDEWVITAAHCVYGDFYEFIEVVLGELDQSTKEGREIIVKLSEKFIIHPKFNIHNYDYDVALLHLDKKIQHNQYIRPACLPPMRPVYNLSPGMRCVVSGFGKTAYKGPVSLELRHAEVPIVDKKYCQMSYGKKGHEVTPRMICAGYSTGGVDSCTGDSGGPLVCEITKNSWHLFGIVSWGVGCGHKNKFGVYTDVEKIIEWIHKNIGSK